MSEQTRDWKKEYYDMFRACAESGTAYEKIIAEKNAELSRLQSAARRVLVFKSYAGTAIISMNGFTMKEAMNDLAAALDGKEPK